MRKIEEVSTITQTKSETTGTIRTTGTTEGKSLSRNILPTSPCAPIFCRNGAISHPSKSFRTKILAIANQKKPMCLIPIPFRSIRRKRKARKPRAESRKPKAGSREPEAESRKPGAGCREPEAGSRLPPRCKMSQKPYFLISQARKDSPHGNA